MTEKYQMNTSRYQILTTVIAQYLTDCRVCGVWRSGRFLCYRVQSFQTLWKFPLDLSPLPEPEQFVVPGEIRI